MDNEDTIHITIVLPFDPIIGEITFEIDGDTTDFTQNYYEKEMS